ncbi:unnamed protein product [Closterium sp. NIES-65]|nr:unnamed protein product [Closterium sp. NIES-65]
MDLDHFGGTFGGNRKPTPFMCLILKMLQIQPEKEIVVEFIKNSDYKYVRLLGAFYLRLVSKRMDVYQYLEPLSSDLLFPSPNSHTCHSPPLSHAPPSFLRRYVRLLGAFYLRLVGKPMDVYQYLEPLYNDYRKVRRKLESGTFVLEEFIEKLLARGRVYRGASHTRLQCDIAYPRPSLLFPIPLLSFPSPPIRALPHTSSVSVVACGRVHRGAFSRSTPAVTSPHLSPQSPPPLVPSTPPPHSYPPLVPPTRPPHSPFTVHYPTLPVFVLSHVDEFIQELLTLDSSCDITSPPCSPITARSPPSTLYFPLVFVLSHVGRVHRGASHARLQLRHRIASHTSQV